MLFSEPYQTSSKRALARIQAQDKGVLYALVYIGCHGWSVSNKPIKMISLQFLGPLFPPQFSGLYNNVVICKRPVPKRVVLFRIPLLHSPGECAILMLGTGRRVEHLSPFLSGSDQNQTSRSNATGGPRTSYTAVLCGIHHSGNLLKMQQVYSLTRLATLYKLKNYNSYLMDIRKLLFCLLIAFPLRKCIRTGRRG